MCDPNDPQVLAVIDKFKAKYGETPPDTTYFMETWDAANVLVHVFKTMIQKGIPLKKKELRDAMAKYSGGVPLLTPTPRKSPAWGEQPHIMIRAEDFLPMEIKDGKAFVTKKCEVKVGEFKKSISAEEITALKN